MFRNSDQEVRFIWYPALPNAGVLPVPSAFLDGIWDEWYYEYDGPGPVYRTHIRDNWQKTKAGSGRGHYCGTAEDFAEGGLYDPTLPPVEYSSNHLPVCCDVIQPAVLGGIGVGGHVVPSYTPPPPPFTPGNTCATAAVAQLNTIYTFPSATASNQWIVLANPPSGGVGWLLLQKDRGQPDSQVNFWRGGSCAHLTFSSATNSNTQAFLIFFAGDAGFFEITHVGTSVPMHFQFSETQPTWLGSVYGGVGLGGNVVPTYTP